MADLFQTTPQNVTLPLKAIFAEGELPEQATCKDYLQVRQEGQRSVSRSLRHYRLEAILAVGYRVRSPRGKLFRQWATQSKSQRDALFWRLPTILFQIPFGSLPLAALHLRRKSSAVA